MIVRSRKLLNIIGLIIFCSGCSPIAKVSGYPSVQSLFGDSSEGQNGSQSARDASGKALEGIDDGLGGNWRMYAHPKAASVGGNFDFKSFSTTNDNPLASIYDKSSDAFKEIIIQDEIDYQKKIRWLEGVKMLAEFIDIDDNRVPCVILDTGINKAHPDLDGDIEGVLDARVLGSSGKDLDGHGTGVAGVAGAIGGNDTGLRGIAINPRLFCIKVLATPEDTKTGTNNENEATLALALEELKKLRSKVNLPYIVSNASIGGYNNTLELHELYDELVQNKKGTISVVAAGNENTTKPSYPAAYGYEYLDNKCRAISVGGYDEKSPGNRAWFSNYNKSKNPADQWVHVAAPSIKIFTTSAGLTKAIKNAFGSIIQKKGLTKNDVELLEALYPENYEMYTTETGTSLASPIVTGIIAAGIIKPLLAYQKYGYGQETISQLFFKATRYSVQTQEHPEVLEWTKYGAVDMPSTVAVGLVFAGAKASKVKEYATQNNVSLTDDLLNYLDEIEAEKNTKKKSND